MNFNMKIQLSSFHTDCLLKAVHYYVMHLREMDASGSSDYTSLIGIEKFLLDSISVDITDNLPF